MNRNRSFAIFFFSILALMIGCTKFDTTDLGSGLIPVVDNINTFADTLDITTSQGVFDDTTALSRTDVHLLGMIPYASDPLMGETKASIFLQLKPAFYPYYFGKKGDTINAALDSRTGFDSVVLCLSYKGFWGDSTAPMKLNVVQVNNNNGMWDSVFKTKQLSYAPATSPTILGSSSFDVRFLSNVIRYSNFKDTAVNQIRIRLRALENAFYQCDTSTNNYFRSDSLFKLFNNGFGIIPELGKGLCYINLIDANTRLEVHYRVKSAGKIDTSFSSFKLTTTMATDTAGRITIYPSSTANHVTRNRPALPSGDQELLIQTQPGTYAHLFVDSLTNYSNKIVHRASIIMEQIPGDTRLDSIYSAPALLYMDLRDTTAESKWKPIYYDLNVGTSYDPDYRTGLPFFPTGGVDFGYFGGFARNKKDNLGRNVKYYDFNVTRHVQQIVTKRTPNYKFRLYAPYTILYPQYYPFPYSYGNRLAAGRVKLGGGTHPTSKMKMVVIYSKLK